MESPHRIRRGISDQVSHPQRARLVVRRAESAMPFRERPTEWEWSCLPPTIVEMLDVGGRFRDLLCEFEGTLIHVLPHLLIHRCRIDLDIGARHAKFV